MALHPVWDSESDSDSEPEPCSPTQDQSQNGPAHISDSDSSAMRCTAYHDSWPSCCNGCSVRLCRPGVNRARRASDPRGATAHIGRRATRIRVSGRENIRPGTLPTRTLPTRTFVPVTESLRVPVCIAKKKVVCRDWKSLRPSGSCRLGQPGPRARATITVVPQNPSQTRKPKIATEAEAMPSKHRLSPPSGVECSERA